MVTMSVWHVEQNPKLIEELGRVTVRWAALDLLLVRIASIALKNHPAAQSVIFGESNAGQARFRAFERIIGASFFDEDERSEIIAHMKELSRHYRARNALTHEPLEGTYSIEGKRFKFRLQFVARGGGKKDAALEDIQKHVHSVDEHLEALEAILDRLFERYEQVE
ncbi:MAG: hypothetical protein J0I98_06965 [Mesorhizobium sp.]|nr:hypothetical protein [Mesorhizobium sp.]MBN9242516.1 hypothetical protein [Mesorhizobium sp.]